MTFTADIARFVQRANGNMDKAVQMVTINLAGRVILLSPVADPDSWKHPVKGYVGGRFRANWQFGAGAMNRDFDMDAKDAGGNATLGRLAAAAGEAKAGGVVYLSNSLPYAIPLENGWSQQAPAGVVKTAALEFQQAVSKAAQDIK